MRPFKLWPEGCGSRIPVPRGKTVYGTFKVGLGRVYHTALHFDEFLFRPCCKCTGLPLRCPNVLIAASLSRRWSRMSESLPHLHTDSPESKPTPKQDNTLSPLSPNSPYDTKPTPATTRESWVPNRRVSDSPKPDDDYAMPIPSRFLLDSIRLLRSLLLPLVAVAYIVFCYTVHYKTVPVKSGGLFDNTPSNLGVLCITSFSRYFIDLTAFFSCDQVGCYFN